MITISERVHTICYDQQFKQGLNAETLDNDDMLYNHHFDSFQLFGNCQCDGCANHHDQGFQCPGLVQ